MRPPRRGIGRVTIAIALILIVGLSGLGYLLYEQTAIKPNTVTLLLDEPPNASDAPFYYGISQGIYKQNGINLSLIPGTSPPAAISALEAGKVDFAYAIPTVLVKFTNINNITNLKLVALTYARSQVAIIYNSANIKNISDLQGKTGAMLSPAAGATYGDFQIFCNANGLNISTMNIQFQSETAFHGLLLTGKVQFIVTVIQDYLDLKGAASGQGINLGYFLLSDYGFQSAGDGLATTNSMIQQHPDIVRSFVKATMESYVEAASNQTGAVADLVAANPQLNMSSSLPSYQFLLGCCSASTANLTNPLQYGWMDPHYMQKTVDNEIIAGNLGVTLNATDFYTNEFVAPP